MFRKILIANRGEIACRVIASARALGVKTVAVFSDADAGARHVAMADEAVRIGPAPAAESYLRIDRIVDAARAVGAEAIHPGYGFLSENPAFVAAVEEAGLVFIGPPAPAIRAMGLKDAAKALMIKAGVPVLPGYHGETQDPAFLAAEAARIGYPVIVKARAGGGGKGMRLVERPDDFAEALDGAQREAAASFGDPGCLIEKYVTRPRHIEIQVFGDRHGAVVHLFERDCSLQRRHQKVIEEAPAPGMTAGVRAAMGAAAVEAAKAVGYVGAGTVEFIVDGFGPLREDGFWFLEMNTRLQVEHPVSEAITGLDFVALQLRIAAGEPLPFAQGDLAIDGWAFEARVYAEDAGKGFLPATGALEHLAFPEGGAFRRAPVRVDSGVRQGDEITPWYDPLIAKVIVHGPTRAAALAQLDAALAATRVAGTVSNLDFLRALARHESLVEGRVDTGLIGRDLDALTATPEPSETVIALAAVSALGLLEPRDPNDPWSLLTGWRPWSAGEHEASLMRGEIRLARRVRILSNHDFEILGGAEPVSLSARRLQDGLVAVAMGDRRFRAIIVQTPASVTVMTEGAEATFALPDPLSDAVEDPSGDLAGRSGGDTLAAPMPGLVKLVAAQAGAAVARGEALLVLEAMKMEHTLRAPRDGVVAEVFVAEGDQVTDGALLLSLEPEHD